MVSFYDYFVIMVTDRKMAVNLVYFTYLCFINSFGTKIGRYLSQSLVSQT